MKQKYDEPPEKPWKEDLPPPAPEAHDAPKEGGPAKFQVTLEHAATLVVEAKDEAEAWEEYKRQVGIVASHPIGHAKVERLQP
jgi:hypothetical protein